MNKKFLKIISLLCLTGAVTSISFADSKPTKERVNDSSSTVRNAAEVYKALTKKYHIPLSVARDSRCVAVFPGVISAALAIGGVHGDGVAFCRDDAGQWKNPVFLDLNGGSIGLQAGYQKADVVMFMRAPASRSVIEKGQFDLTGELSAVAGELSEKYIAPQGGVIVYAQSEGVFAGASLNGVKLSHDEDEQKAFYGTYDRKSLWEGKIPEGVKQSVMELKQLLPS